MSRFELAVRGWTRVDGATAVAEAARSVLGAAATAEPGTAGTGWTVADPVPSGEPLGPARSLVHVSGEGFGGDGLVRFVPGSQGCPPPPEDAGDAVVELALEPGRSLLLDGRCWFSTSATAGGRGAPVELWLARPAIPGPRGVAS